MKSVNEFNLENNGILKEKKLKKKVMHPPGFEPEPQQTDWTTA